MNNTNMNNTNNIQNTSNMNNPKNQKYLHNVMKDYENLSYLDQYGGSVLLVVLTFILLFLGISYCIVMINIKPIQDNWTSERCKPYIMPFAGMINKPSDMSSTDFTKQNFDYCMQNIIEGSTSEALQPITFIVSFLNSISNIIKEGINSVRKMINKVRTQIQTISQEIMGRLANIMVPLQQIIISVRDMVSKMQGVMTTGLYTLLGSYYTLQSLLGAIGQIIVTILIVLALAAAMLWIIPITWGAAAAMTAIFIALAVPFALILVFLKDTMKIGGGLKIPSIKCFDEDTCLLLQDGREKKIGDIEVGDKLQNNDEVTSKIKVITEGSQMYNLYGIIVSDSHIVNYKDKWIHVSEHPEATIVHHYTKPYLYCLNTVSKQITIHNIIFTDWDEIYGTRLNSIKKHLKLQYPILNAEKHNDIHKYLNSGFSKDTSILLQNGVEIPIINVRIGDILENGEKVYGIVKINGCNLDKQYIYHLGKENNIHCSQNIHVHNKSTNMPDSFLNISNKENIKIEIATNEECLFHLLTDKKTFWINNTQFYDYNASIDAFLQKY